MSKRGSAGDEPEDPDTNVDDTDQLTGAPPETQEPTATQPSTEKVDTPPKEPKAAKPAGDDDGEAKDPVAEMIDRLASDGPAADEDAQAKKPAAKPGDKPAAAKVSPAGTPPPKAEPSDQPGQPGPADAEGDAVERLLTPEQRKNTKGSVKTVIRNLDTEMRTTKSKLAEMEPNAAIGKAWDGLVQKHKLDDAFEVLEDTQIAYAIQSQASIARAVAALTAGRQPSAQDQAAVGEFLALAADVGKRVGKPIAGDASSMIAGFQGAIPQDLKDLKEVYGAIEDDDELKLLAAFRASKAKTATKAKAPEVAAAAEAPPAPAPKTEAQAHWSKEDEQLHGRQTAREIGQEAGLKPEQVSGFFTESLAPLIIERLKADFPGRDPVALFSKGLSPSTRAKLVSEALGTWKAASAQRSTPPRKPASPPPIRTQGTGRAPGAPNGGVDTVAELIDRLASDRD